jgi:uncharacterized membrane protein YbhN (UPF0104 family)
VTGRLFLRGSRWQLRLAASALFVILTVGASVLVARRLTQSSWPLDHVEPWLTAAAALAYLASFFFRARAWHRLFPCEARPDQGRCLASVGAAAASGAVLPFRLDYVVKVGVLRKLGGARVGLGAIALSIVSLGMIDAIAMLPLSISATATSNTVLRGPLVIVVVFGLGCCTLLVAGGRMARLPLVRRSRRLRALGEYVSHHTARAGRKDVVVAWVYLFVCWSSRAFGSAALLSALGLSFSPRAALAVICLAAAAGVIPITSGGAVANAGAGIAILLALGVGKDIAINFSLASGLLIVVSAVTASMCGVLASIAFRQRSVPGLVRPGAALTR